MLLELEVASKTSMANASTIGELALTSGPPKPTLTRAPPAGYVRAVVKRPLGRVCACALVVLLVGALVAPGVASARTLSLNRARLAAYHVARSVGAQEGAVYAIAGYCKRHSAVHVNCWAAIIFDDYTGAAQQVSVTLRGGKVHPRRFGRVYTGSVGQQSSSQSGGEWAICGIHSSVCIGS
jgi:hypothetical protein